jgi:hypothetical protein
MQGNTFEVSPRSRSRIGCTQMILRKANVPVSVIEMMKIIATAFIQRLRLMGSYILHRLCFVHGKNSTVQLNDD